MKTNSSRRCEFNINIVSIEMYSIISRVNALEVISLETDLDEDMLKGAKLQVYTIAGSLEKSIPVVGKVTQFTLSKAGTFIVKLRTKSGFEEEFKIIAK